jgi:two-component system heavy metal sensor histidine kinase CusS
MHSLRTRLLTRTALLLACTMSLAAISIYLLMRTALISQFNAALLVEARSLATHVEQSEGEISIESEVNQLPVYSSLDHPHYFQLWVSDGRTLVRSGSLKDRSLDRPQGLTDEPVYALTTLPSGSPGRQVSFQFEPRFEGENPTHQRNAQVARIAVARDSLELDATLRTLAALLFLVTAATVLGSIAVLRSIVAGGLRPLNTLASRIERVGSTDLSERVQIADAPQEMMPIVERLNDLLARLEDRFERERSFTADVAHELRTPLAGLHTALEVCTSQTRDARDYQRTAEKCLSITRQMHALVSDLLTLARADANQLSVEVESVEVHQLLQDCWSPLEEMAAKKRLKASWHSGQIDVLPLDREKARVVLNNLFENAVAHAEERGFVEITSAADDSVWSVTVSNNCSNLRPADLTRLFDRFWRADEARSSAGLHCGLGLSVCQRLLGVLGGWIEAQLTENVFSIRANFPIRQLPTSETSTRLLSVGKQRVSGSEKSSGLHKT